MASIKTLSLIYQHHMENQNRCSNTLASTYSKKFKLKNTKGFIMHKIIATVLISLLSSISTAGTIAYLEDNKVGERVYVTLNTSSIKQLIYDEDDKTLTARVSLTNLSDFDFKVESYSKAKSIISKLYDKNDNSVIELELD